MELWKPIKNYEDLYEVSNLGRIRYVKENKIIKGRYLKSARYREVTLYSGRARTCYFVHYLVAKAFVENPNHYSIVIHKNGRRLDNRANNLKWVKEKPLYDYNKSITCKITCVESDKQFDSLFDAAAYIQKEAFLSTPIMTIKKNIHRACKKGITAYKYHWKFN